MWWEAVQKTWIKVPEMRVGTPFGGHLSSLDLESPN